MYIENRIEVKRRVKIDFNIERFENENANVSIRHTHTNFITIK
jgi:hypothetical protein